MRGSRKPRQRKEPDGLSTACSRGVRVRRRIRACAGTLCAADDAAGSGIRRRLEPAGVGGAAQRICSRRRRSPCSSRTRRRPDSWSRRCSTASPTSRSPRSTTSSRTRRARAKRRSPTTPTSSRSWAATAASSRSSRRRRHVGRGPERQDGFRRRDDDRLRVRHARARRAQRPRGSRRHVRARGRHREPLPRSCRRQARCDAAAHAVRAARRERAATTARDRRDARRLPGHGRARATQLGARARSGAGRLPPRVQGRDRLALRSREPRRRRSAARREHPRHDAGAREAIVRPAARRQGRIVARPRARPRGDRTVLATAQQVRGAAEDADGSAAKYVDLAYYDKAFG